MASLNSALTMPAASRPVALNYQLTMALPRVSNDRNPAERRSFYLPAQGNRLFRASAHQNNERIGEVCHERHTLHIHRVPVQGMRTWFTFSMMHQQKSSFAIINTRHNEFFGLWQQGKHRSSWFMSSEWSCGISSNWCDFKCEFRYVKWIFRICIVMIIIH